MLLELKQIYYIDTMDEYLPGTDLRRRHLSFYIGFIDNVAVILLPSPMSDNGFCVNMGYCKRKIFAPLISDFPSNLRD